MSGERVRDIGQHSRRLLRDLNMLLERVRYARSPRDAGALERILRAALADTTGVVYRHLALANGQDVLVTFIDHLVANWRIEDFIIRPLSSIPAGPGSPPLTLERLANRYIAAGDVKTSFDIDEILDDLLRGDTLVALSGSPGVLVVSTRKPPARPVSDAQIEVVARGPRDSFTETAVWNLALIRRRLVDVNLRTERLVVGARSKTAVYLVYIDDVVNRTALQEMRRRLRAVSIDAVLDSGMLEQLIEDCWWTPFPQAERTERPDVVVAALLEGRLALITDNTPLAIVAPTTFSSLFDSPEDAYSRPTVVSLLRVTRFVATGLALSLPALYVAVASYTPALLPLRLAIKIANSREGVALPVVVEALLMQLFLEILREAGFRLPGPIGQTFGVVGGIVIGEFAVRAGLVSEMMVVVIALTGLASFTSPSLMLGTSIRLLGLPLLLMASVLGIYGFLLGLAGLLAHLVSLRSLGIPYLVPFAFYPPSDYKDMVLRAPIPAFKQRPTFYGPQQRRRAGDRRRDLPDTRAGSVHRAAGVGNRAHGQ
ncbi:MAG: spore germination protein [Bacillota bacterium]